MFDIRTNRGAFKVNIRGYANRLSIGRGDLRYDKRKAEQFITDLS